MYRKTTFERGFTLVEVSIVLALLGLLVGTVMGARVYMRNQELNRVLIDARSYAIAFEQFKIKYNAIPGDMINATEIWGRADGGAPITSNCASPNNTFSNGSRTCSGDGDGILNWYTALVGTPPPHEPFRAWQQMAAAGLIAGNYNGAGTSAGFAVTSASGFATLNGWKYSYIYSFPGTPGKILPSGPLENSLYAWLAGPAIVNNTASADDVFFDGNYSNSLLYGAYLSALNGPAPGFAPIFRPQEQYVIDQKFDDGMPATGIVRAAKRARGIATPCPSGSSITATYNISETGVVCSIIYMTTQITPPPQ